MTTQDVDVTYHSNLVLVGKVARIVEPACYLFIGIVILSYAGTDYLVHPIQTAICLKLGIHPHLLDGYLMALGLIIGLLAGYFKRAYEESKITLNEDSLEIPSCCDSSMQKRRKRLWGDVSHVAIIDGQKDGHDRLVLLFSSGGRATLDLDRIERSQLEKLLLCIEMRATTATRDITLATQLEILHDEKTGNGELSFTHLWELDMNRRFSSMAYVPLEPGQVIDGGRTKIVSQLAFGGLSAVYLAKRNAQTVVVKEAAVPIKTNSGQYAKAEEMLRREAALLLQLSHPQIVKVLDFFVENDKAYIILQYLQGENLRQIVYRNGPIDEGTCLNWMLQLCDILNYLHQHEPPIVHRDISPDNIIVDSTGRLVLIDFGTANEFVVTATGTLVGKQSYMSPEQFKGKATPASDLYSLGATMFFLLTGMDPEPLSELHPQEQNEKITDGMNQLVFDSTRLDLEQRLNSATDLLGRIKVLAEPAGIITEVRESQPSGEPART